MKERMNKLNEEILAKFLMGECTEDELREVNAWLEERARLMRRYEQLKQEIQIYENNMGFLNASSKKGNSLIDEMNRKVQKLKDDMNLVREKIKAIDAEN